MCATAAKHADSILLFDVPWKAYEGLIDALPDHRVPHTYQEGTLELFKTVFYGVPWEAYEEILEAFGDRRFPHTYQDGTLEIMMSPSEDHEQIKSFLGRLIEITCLELGVHFKAVGSATQRKEARLQGLEPDESYYLPYVPERHKVGRGWAKAKPTPDLAIEIDLRKLDVLRMKTYARLGVRELWRYHKRKVEFFHLSRTGKYERMDSSRIFPIIASKDVTRFLDEMRDTDDYQATQAYLVWLRERTKKPARSPRKKGS